MTTTDVTTVPIRREQYIGALIAGSPTMTPQVRAALPTALALALTARADGSRALLSAAQIGRLLTGAGGERTVVRHLKALRDAGWLDQTSRGGLRGKKAVASVYALCAPHAIGGVLVTSPNTPPRKRQQATHGAPLSLSKERDPAHSGARSPKVARHPVRKPDVQNLELRWPRAKAAGDDAIFGWLFAYLAVAGANLAVAWMLEHGGNLWDFEDVGLPQSGEINCNRVLWMCNLTIAADESGAEVWNWPNVQKAIRDALTCGYTEPIAWSMLWSLAYDGCVSPLLLNRALNEDIGKPATKKLLADAEALLLDWEAVAAERQGRPPITDVSAIPMVPPTRSAAA